MNVIKGGGPGILKALDRVFFSRLGSVFVPNRPGLSGTKTDPSLAPSGLSVEHIT